MPGVIKADAAGAAVTAFARAAAFAAPEKSAIERALGGAHEEIAALQAALRAARDAGARAERAAHDAGRSEGLAESVADHAALVEQVGATLDGARIAWDERLAGLDTLAVMLARAALDRVFDAPADMADLVARTIASRIAALRDGSIVAIHVGAVDFPDGPARAALAARAGAVTIFADAALDSGACRIDLQLGHVDCGIGTQWRELDAFLAALETPR